MSRRGPGEGGYDRAMSGHEFAFNEKSCEKSKAHASGRSARYESHEMVARTTPM